MKKHSIRFALVLIGAVGGCLTAASAHFVLPDKLQEVIVEKITVRGNRRTPEATIKSWMSIREGDPYDPIQIDRDVQSIYGRAIFRTVNVSVQAGTRGGKLVIFDVQEKPLVLDVLFDGLKSVRRAAILEEFQKTGVIVLKETLYDPIQADRAAAVIKEMLAGKGRREARVEPAVEEISLTVVAIKFKVTEGCRCR
jgi:outer membrane protein insertion porin family